MVKIRRALISVSDKRNLVDFVKELHSLDVEIISTEGTKKVLAQAGILVKSVSEYTKAKEMLDGRVKTLHPKIHAGILAKRDNEKHIRELKDASIGLIDMVIVNLYPFEETIDKEDSKLKDALENIDIGGPSLLRAAAKNYRYVAAVCDPDQYFRLIEELKDNNNRFSDKTLTELAARAFKYTSEYDKIIYKYLKANINLISPDKKRYGSDFSFAQEVELHFKKIQDLRYGENPHQKGAFYRDDKVTEPSVGQAKQLHGKELSFNNIMDLNSALEIIKDFTEPAACIIKHINPSGVAKSKDLKEAYKNALECDPMSAFGSVVGLNKVVDEDTAKLIYENFIECVLAPGYTEKALEILRKKKNIRILDIPKINKRGMDIDIKKITGGILLQEKDIIEVNRKSLKVVTKKKPTSEQIDSLLFAWNVCKYVKSNAIVLVKGNQTVGIGAGQMSRVDSVIIATRKAGKRAKSSVLASDAFFPKEDALKAAHKAGIRAIIQPGGSIKDEEIIREADKLNMSMVFTGIRHFRH